MDKCSCLSGPSQLAAVRSATLVGVDGRREHQPYWGLGGGCYDEWIDDWLERSEDR